MHRRHDPLTWRHILDAVDHADRTVGTAERAGQDWCHMALAVAPHVHSTQPADSYGDRIDVNPGMWWRWLNAPVVNVDGQLTVADFLDFPAIPGTSRYMPDRTARGLVRAAVSAGLFGVAGAEIEVHQVINGEDEVGLLLVARTNAGVGIATPVIAPTGLPPHPSGDRMADALAVLTTAADHVNETLDLHDGDVRSEAHGAESSRHARPFPTLTDMVAPAPATKTLPAGPSIPPGRSR